MNKTIIYPKHACQFCGSTKKLVETIIDDEFIWNENENTYKPKEFSDEFEHTGAERCTDCKREWTGMREH